MTSESPNPYAPPQAAVQDIVATESIGTPADRGIRLAAMLLDNIIAGAMIYVPFFAVAIGAGAFAGDSDAAVSAVVAALGVGLVGFGVWLWLTVRYLQRNGQSIAKKLLGIRVVRSDGSRASAARIIWLRNVVNGLIGIVPAYVLIDALFIFGERRQCLHDMIADTLVVNA